MWGTRGLYMWGTRGLYMLVGSVRLLHVGTQPRVGSVRFEHGNTEAGKWEDCTCRKTVSGECEV